MEQSPSLEANRFSSSQEIPSILWSPMVHYRVHKFPKVSVQHLFRPHAVGPPLVGCLQLLIQYIRSYPLQWRPFLHPQPEDAPYRGDRDQLITANHSYGSEYIYLKRDVFASDKNFFSYNPIIRNRNVQGGSNMTGTDLYVNKPHCAAAV